MCKKLKDLSPTELGEAMGKSRFAGQRLKSGDRFDKLHPIFYAIYKVSNGAITPNDLIPYDTPPQQNGGA